jgi:hypothetical protein
MKIESLATLPFTKLAEGQPKVEKRGDSLTITLDGILITFGRSDIPKLTRALAPK